MALLLKEGDIARIVPEGDIVASSVPEVREKLKEAIDAGFNQITVELGGVKMIDSMGIALLIAARNSLEARNGRLKLLNVDAEIYSLMKLMRLDQHMEIVAA